VSIISKEHNQMSSEEYGQAAIDSARHTIVYKDRWQMLEELADKDSKIAKLTAQVERQKEEIRLLRIFKFKVCGRLSRFEDEWLDDALTPIDEFDRKHSQGGDK